MTVTVVPFGMLSDVQGWNPGGMFVRSESRLSVEVQVGDLVRSYGWWAVVTSTGRSPSGLVSVEVRAYGETYPGTAILLTDGQSVEVRADTRIDPATIPVA